MANEAELVERLRNMSDNLMKYAELASNMNSPATDNNFGRDATVFRQSGDAIDRLTAERDAAQAKLAEAVKVIKRISHIMHHYFGEQDEKVEDIEHIANAFLDTLEDKPADGGDK